MKKLITFLLLIIVALLYMVYVQSDTIKQLRYDLSDSLTSHENFDSTVYFERGYEAGYSEGYNEVLRYFEDYIGTEEFLNDYSLKRDY